MELLKLKRMQLIQQQLYEFNYLKPNFYDNSWSEFINQSGLDCMYQDLTDNFLKIIILPLCQFQCILYESILTLLLKDNTILISGKKLGFLNKFFSEKQITNAIQRTKIVPDLVVVDNLLLQLEDFYNQSALYLCSQIYYDKHDAMYSRLALRFNCHLVVDASIKNFYNKFSLNTLEKIILIIAKSKAPNNFNLKFENK